MAKSEPKFFIRRILVALDASGQSLAALDEAAALAAILEGEIEGLFVEDIRLLRLAALPFTRQISYFSGAEEPFDVERIERELKAQAESARRAVEAAAKRGRRPWTFRTVRGDVTAEILNAAAEADILLLGKVGWSHERQPGAGSTALAAASSCPGALLLAQQSERPAKQIFAAYDGSPGSRRSLGAAIALANLRRLPLVVLTCDVRVDALAALGELLRREFEDMPSPARFRTLTGCDPRHLARALHDEGGGLLVLDAKCAFAQDGAIETLLRETEDSILLIR